MVFMQNKAEVTQTRRKSKYKILGWKERKRMIFFSGFFPKAYTVMKFFLEKILLIFRDRGGREKGKERIIDMWEEHQWVASHTPPTRTWPAPMHVPWLEIEPLFTLQDDAQLTEPCQPGLYWKFLVFTMPLLDLVSHISITFLSA